MNKYLIQNSKGSFLIDRKICKDYWWASFESDPLFIRFNSKQGAELAASKLTDVKIVKEGKANALIKARLERAKKSIKRNNLTLGDLLDIKCHVGIDSDGNDVGLY